jgi:hypothetical protein
MVSATVFDWLYHAVRWTWHDADGYNFISGPLADITLLGAGYAILRRHNCHVGGCWRIGRAPVHGTSYIVCKKHHPHEAPTVEQVHAAHQAAIAGGSSQATATAAAAAQAESAARSVRAPPPDHPAG